MTPHISAKLDEISPLVLITGDPLRAEMMSKKFLTASQLVNKVRNLFIYTGYYQKTKITIATSGMGQASTGIIVYELLKYYQVKTIIRLGSCGVFSANYQLKELLLAEKSSSSVAYLPEFYNDFHITPSFYLNNLIKAVSKEKNIPLHTDINVWSSHEFYYQDLATTNALIKINDWQAVEMESFPLFVLAKFFQANTACILTVSDIIGSKSKEKKAFSQEKNQYHAAVKLSSQAREQNLEKMFILGLESLKKFSQEEKKLK